MGGGSDVQQNCFGIPKISTGTSSVIPEKSAT